MISLAQMCPCGFDHPEGIIMDTQTSYGLLKLKRRFLNAHEGA